VGEWEYVPLSHSLRLPVGECARSRGHRLYQEFLYLRRTMSRQPIDDDTWQACVAGEPAALAALHGYGRRITALKCHSYGFHLQEADDLAEEFYLYLTGPAPMRLQDYPGGGYFATWLFWRLRGFLSHAARSQPRKLEIVLPEAPEVADTAASLTVEASALAHLNSENLRCRIASALEHVPEGERIVFWLRAIEGVPHSDTAARLGLSEVAVRKRYQRACCKLRDLLGTVSEDL
jgi:RNA polymerase sigma factor (sigma-70 family)